MTINYQCPICAEPLLQHQASQGFYCSNRHRFDRHERGYWVFAQPKRNKGQQDSRQLMRAKKHLLESGMYAPVVKALKEQVLQRLSQQPQLAHLDIDCADGYYVRAIADAVTQSNIEHSYSQVGLCDAENAAFAAVKSHPLGCYLLGTSQRLPFADDSFDLVSVIDKPLKGKESIRVLKPGGYLLHVAAGPRHLWQLKQQVFPESAEKAVNLALPKELTLVSSERLGFTAKVTPEQLLTLLDMAPYSWRINDKQRKQLAASSIEQMEFDFVLSVAQYVGK